MKSSIKRCGCCLIWLLISGVLVAAALWLTYVRVQAAVSPAGLRQRAGPNGPGQQIFLVMDESPSMAECEGAPGSDPDLLRKVAARLFVSYLGADSAYARYQVGLLHFGGETREVMGLVNLADEVARQQLLVAVETLPEPISWTNPLAALYRARMLLTEQYGQPMPTGSVSPARTVVILTDGEPAWPQMNASNEQDYRDALRDEILEYRTAEITLFIILLQNPTNQCSQRVTAYWQEMWQELATGTPAGELYLVDQATDLLPTYHAIVRRLVGATASDVLAEDAPLPEQTVLELPITLEAPVAGMILTILKDAGTTVEVIAPDGQLVRAHEPSVTVVEDAQQSVYRLANPMVGTWLVRLFGSGRISVYQDRIPLPLATATPTFEPTATPTTTPSATPTATPPPTEIPTSTPTVTPPPTSTSTATPTMTPLPTSTSTLLPTVTSTLLPVSTATDIPLAVEAEEPPQGVMGLGRWLWLVGGLLVLVSGSAAYTFTRRDKGHYHAGRITIIQAPSADPNLYLVEDLGIHSQKRFAIGKGAGGAWRLAEWPGRLELEAGPRGSTVATTREGEVLLVRNSPYGPMTKPLLYPTPLVDGDLLVCGDYRIRYDNVLAELSAKLEL